MVFCHRLRKEGIILLHHIRPLSQVQNELEAQRIATDFAHRKRTHHLNQAHQELQWQLKTVNVLQHLLLFQLMFLSQK